jgi:hypothetical protein
VLLPQAVPGAKTVPPPGAPCPDLLSRRRRWPLAAVARRWSWVLAVLDRIVGATAVESGKAEPAGSGRGGACGVLAWAVVLLARDSGAA